MNKMLTSLLMIIIATSLVATGTYAYFSDTEVSTDNTFTAGTFDLTVDGANDPDVTTKVTLEDMAPGDWEVIGPIELKNVGTIDGIADLHFNNVVDEEDSIDSETGVYAGSSDPELEADPTGAVYDISNQIWVDVWFDEDQDGVQDDGEVIFVVGQVTLNDLNENDFDLGYLSAGQSGDLYLSFHLDDATDNTYQGDYTTFDIEFTMHQDIDQPLVTLPVLELTDFGGWILDGRGSMAITSLGVLVPQYGDTMAFIATGPTGPGTGSPIPIASYPGIPSGATEGSSLHTTMVVPEWATTLTFDYNFLTNDYWPYNDGFVSLVVVQGGASTLVAQESVNTATSTGTGGFYYQTGWKSASTSVTSGEEIEIYMTTYDVADDVADSGALIDRVMFS